MKRLFIPIALLALACTKQRPDWDQVTCKDVTYWQQEFTDSVHNIAISDSSIVYRKQLCTSNPHYKSEITKATGYLKWEELCDADGFKYCLKLYATIQ